MIVYLINEIEMVGVFDRGVPNEERIVLRVVETSNLGCYGLMIGVRLADGSAFPIRDNLFWFGDAGMSVGDWLFVYTGPGQATVSELPNTQERLYSVHWGRRETILADPNIVPILFRTDAVVLPVRLAALPQLKP